METTWLLLSALALLVLVLLVYACFRENGPCRSPTTRTPVEVFLAARPLYDKATDPQGRVINRLALMAKFYHEALVLRFDDPDTLQQVVGSAANVHTDYTNRTAYSRWDQLVATPFKPVFLSLELYARDFLGSPVPDVVDGRIVPCEAYTTSRLSNPSEWQEFLSVGKVANLARLKDAMSKALGYATTSPSGAARAPHAPPLLYSLYNVYATLTGEQVVFNCTCHTLVSDVLSLLALEVPKLSLALHDSLDVFALQQADVGLKDPGAAAYFSHLRAGVHLAEASVLDGLQSLKGLLYPEYVVGYKDPERLETTCFKLTGVVAPPVEATR